MTTQEEERISLSEGREEHRSPVEGAECKISFDDIDATNYCEYQTSPSMLWFPAQASQTTIEYMQKTQFHEYLKKIDKADCAAAMRRLLDAGPPIYIQEGETLPIPHSETHITKLWFMANNTTISSKLDGAVEGEERQKLWDSLNALNRFALDDDDDEKATTSREETNNKTKAS